MPDDHFIGSTEGADPERERLELALTMAIRRSMGDDKKVAFDADGEHVYIGPIFREGKLVVERYQLGSEARQFVNGEFDGEDLPEGFELRLLATNKPAAVPRQHESDLTPECDRCKQETEVGGLMDGKSMQFVCFNCMTPSEKDRLLSGRDPFGGEG